jgi:hypothetical protein
MYQKIALGPKIDPADSRIAAGYLACEFEVEVVTYRNFDILNTNNIIGV